MVLAPGQADISSRHLSALALNNSRLRRTDARTHTRTHANSPHRCIWAGRRRCRRCRGACGCSSAGNGCSWSTRSARKKRQEKWLEISTEARSTVKTLGTLCILRDLLLLHWLRCDFSIILLHLKYLNNLDAKSSTLLISFMINPAMKSSGQFVTKMIFGLQHLFLLSWKYIWLFDLCLMSIKQCYVTVQRPVVDNH